MVHFVSDPKEKCLSNSGWHQGVIQIFPYGFLKGRYSESTSPLEGEEKISSDMKHFELFRRENLG